MEGSFQEHMENFISSTGGADMDNNYSLLTYVLADFPNLLSTGSVIREILKNDPKLGCDKIMAFDYCMIMYENRPDESVKELMLKYLEEWYIPNDFQHTDFMDEDEDVKRLMLRGKNYIELFSQKGSTIEKKLKKLLREEY